MLDVAARQVDAAWLAIWLRERVTFSARMFAPRSTERARREQYAPMEDGLESNKAAVAAHFAALNSGDYSSLVAIHAPSGRNHAHAPFDLSEWPAEGVPFGPVEVQGTFEWLRSSVPDLRAEVEVLVAEGDDVVAWVKMSGTQSGHLGTVGATGRHVEFHHAHRFRLADAMIIEHWAVRDDLRAMLQSGVVRPPDAAT